MLFALINMMSIPLLLMIKADPKVSAEKANHGLLTRGWNLLKENPAFAHYQILFFIGGAGIIGSQSILPFYFKDSLNLSYTQLGIAFSLCKGLSICDRIALLGKYCQSHFLVSSEFHRESVHCPVFRIYHGGRQQC